MLSRFPFLPGQGVQIDNRLAVGKVVPFRLVAQVEVVSSVAATSRQSARS